MSKGEGRRRAWIVPIIATFVVFSVLILPGFFIGCQQHIEYLDHLELDKREEDLEESCHLLQTKMLSVVDIVNSLATIMSFDIDNDTLEEYFPMISLIMLDQLPSLKGLAILPEGEIRFAYPSSLMLMFTNLNFFDTQNVTIKEGLEKLKESRDVGIFRPGSSYNIEFLLGAKALYKHGELLGLAAVIIDINSMMEKVGLRTEEMDMNVKIINSDGIIMWDDGPEVKGEEITMNLQIGDMSWTMVVISNVNWSDNSKIQFGIVFISFALVSIMILCSIYFFTFINRKLKIKVEDRTHDLSQRTISLEDEVSKRIRSEELSKDEKDHAELYLDIMSHDVGNLHQGLMLNLQLLDKGIAKGDMQDKCRKDSMDLLKRSFKLVNNVKLLSYLKESEYKREKIDLKASINTSVQEVKGMFPDLDPTIDLEFPKGSIFVNADNLLDQALINLMNNAIKVQEVEKPWIKVDAKVESGDVVVMISDKGPGLNDEIKQIAFNRTEMKKRRKRTSGLGLMIVKTLMDRYGGKIWIEDRIKGDHKQGTCFILKFKTIDN
jgi:signal transduction histidine kinase